MTSATNSLFVQPNGLPIFFFIEPNEIPQSTRKHLTRTIELYGGGICMNASQAHIILVVRGTAEAEKYANLWTPPPECKPVLDYLWVKTCIGRGGLLVADHNWDGLLVPHDEAETDEAVIQFQSVPESNGLANGTIVPSMIAGGSSTDTVTSQHSSTFVTPQSNGVNSLSVNGNQSNLAPDVFRSMTSGFPSQSALNPTGSTATFPSAFHFPGHLVQNSIPVAFIQPQMLAQFPFLYNPTAGPGMPNGGLPDSHTTTPSTTMVTHDRQTSVTEAGSSPSSRSIPARKEVAASRNNLSSSRSSRTRPMAADASSSSKRISAVTSRRQPGATNVSTPAPLNSRNKSKRPGPRERSQSPPSERRRGLRSAASEPSKFFVTHDGDPLRFYIPMDVGNHMEILENIRTHGGRGTPIGYSDYVILDSPVTLKLLPQIQQLGIRGITPGWVDACVEAEGLLPVDDWEVHDEADLLPKSPEPRSRRSPVDGNASQPRSHKRKIQEGKKKGIAFNKPKLLESLASLTPEQRGALPSGPKLLVPHAGGYRFTHEDSQFLIDYANVRFTQDSDLSISTILAEVANHTRASHSYESWRRYYKDQTDVWKLYIQFPFPKSASLDAEHDVDGRDSQQPSGETVSRPSKSPITRRPRLSTARRSLSESDRPLPAIRPSTPRIDVDMEAGSGQKYTPEEVEFFFDFIAWSYMHDPEATRTSIIRELAEKVPRHSTGSWSSMWHTQKDVLEALRQRVIAHIPSNGVSKMSSPESDHDAEGPSEDEAEARMVLRDTPPPEPPLEHKYNSNGFCEYPPEDYRFLIDFVRWVARRESDMMQTELVQLLAQHAPYHTERGWENYLRKHKAEVTKAMQEQSVKTREGIPSVAEPADSLMPRPLHDPPNGQEIDAFEDEDGASAQVTERTFDEILAHLETIADPWSSSEDAWEPFAESHPDHTAGEWLHFVEEHREVIVDALLEKKSLRESYLVESELESDIQENEEMDHFD